MRQLTVNVLCFLALPLVAVMYHRDSQALLADAERARLQRESDIADALSSRSATDGLTSRSATGGSKTSPGAKADTGASTPTAKPGTPAETPAQTAARLAAVNKQISEAMAAQAAARASNKEHIKTKFDSLPEVEASGLVPFRKLEGVTRAVKSLRALAAELAKPGNAAGAGATKSAPDKPDAAAPPAGRPDSPQSDNPKPDNPKPDAPAAPLPVRPDARTAPDLARSLMPADLVAVEGKRMAMTGFLMVAFPDGDVREAVLAKNPWDECCLGIPPTLWDSVVVDFRKGGLKRVDRLRVVTVTGTFRIRPEYGTEGDLEGLFRLEDAEETSLEAILAASAAAVPSGGAAGSGAATGAGGGAGAGAAAGAAGGLLYMLALPIILVVAIVNNAFPSRSALEADAAARSGGKLAPGNPSDKESAVAGRESLTSPDTGSPRRRFSIDD